jgi:hypothetical protein
VFVFQNTNHHQWCSFCPPFHTVLLTAGRGKERYGGAEFGESDLIEKRKIEVVCTRYVPIDIEDVVNELHFFTAQIKN